MKGQGLVEYALIVVLVLIVVIVIVALVLPVIQGNPCVGDNKSTYECRDYQVQQCVKDERYNREECIALVGGGK